MSATTKITLITGGSRGLGRNAALHVAAGGGDVIITYRSNRTEADAVVDVHYDTIGFLTTMEAFAVKYK